MFPVMVCTDTDFQRDSFKQHFLSILFEMYSIEHKGPQKPNATESTGVWNQGKRTD